MNGDSLKRDFTQTFKAEHAADVLELPSLSVNKPSPIGRAVLATAGVALALIPLAVIIGTRHKIVVFAIALLFAYVLLPAVSWVEARLPARWPRSLALAIIYWALNERISSCPGARLLFRYFSHVLVFGPRTDAAQAHGLWKRFVVCYCL